MFNSIRWRIAAPFIILIAVVVLVTGFSIAYVTTKDQLNSLTISAQGQTEYVSNVIRPLLLPSLEKSALQTQVNLAANFLHGTEFSVFDGNGLLLASSSIDSPISGDTPEVNQALSGNTGLELRPAQPGDKNSLFIAVPILDGAEVNAVLRGSFSTSSITNSGNYIRISSVLAAFAVSLFTLWIASLIATRSFRPLRDLTRTAQEIDESQSSLAQKRQRDELSQLTQAFNTMSTQLQSQITALNSERSKLAAVLQQMTDGVAIVDATGRIQLFNRSAEKLFGIPESNAMGRTLAEVLRDHRLVELWEKCQDSGEEQATNLEIHQTGMFMQCIATPLQNSLPGNVLLLFQDLTRIRRLEMVRRDFISNISHELRTPLASLKALTETLQAGALEDPPAAHHFLSKMETEVDALSHMVSELLELTRIESGKVPLHITPVRPVDLLLPARDRLILQAERENLQINLDCDPNLPMVLADAPRIQQVVVNLLHNAIKFTPPGGKIDLGAIMDDSKIIFSVNDTGVGIPAEDLPRIFERFYKADRARSGGGTGLGLAISRHIVEAHGGQIWAESIEGKGSTFYFSLMIA
jgi:two-component system phosphate regulon sensor histidine kinase PhoR